MCPARFACATGLLFRQRGGGDLRTAQQLGRRLRQRAEGVAKHALAERAGSADYRGTSGHKFFRARDVDTLALFLTQEHLPAAGATAEGTLAGARWIGHIRVARQHAAWLVI